MKDNWKISSYQFGLLVVLFCIGSSILLVPGGLAAESKQDAWISVILGIGSGLIFVCLYAKLGSLYPEKNIHEICEVILGKWFGKFISLLFVFFAFFSTVSLLWVTGNFLTTHILMGTPMIVVNILFAAVLILGVRVGIETIARTAEILFPLILVFFGILITFNAPNMEFKNILPLFETEVKPILRGTLLYLSVTTLPLIVLLTISPDNLARPQDSTKIFCAGTFIAGGILLTLTATSILVLGAESTAVNQFPSYVLARAIRLGDILERTEAILTGLWINAIFYKAVLYFYGAVVGLAQTLELKDYRPITIPLGMIAVVFSLIVYPDIAYANKWDTTTWISFSMTYGLFLPVVLLIVGLFRKK